MTGIHVPEQMGRLAREVIASYEARISSVERIVEATHEMLATFRSQREAMRAKLRETLARVASLRRRDFDAMMDGILARQEAREQAIKETIRHYLAEQRALAAALKEALARGEAERTGSVKELLKGIETGRGEREREVRALLADFQLEQEELAQALGGLLSNGGPVRVKEFKATLRAIQADRPCPPLPVTSATQTGACRGREQGGRDGSDAMRVLSERALTATEARAPLGMALYRRYP